MTAVERAPGAPNESKKAIAVRERNLTRLQARLNVEAARGDFVGTLNALEDRLNFPKRIDRAKQRAVKRVRKFADEQPVAAAAAAVGLVAAAGGVIWLVVRNATKS
ncbi:hypothetical protein ACGGZK_02890 [Agromyces sp. MMS24-K17]|uniref:hypothetical protein n=1 Tax=Agromyces sp. MMS24-K17 TaxID=3372850 RepID=UPI003754525D